MSMITSSYYGIAAEPVQPTGGAGPQPTPELTTPIATAPAPGRAGLLGQPSFWIVAILAAAVGLVHLSIRLS